MFKNFYPDQYKSTNKHPINHNYLTEQFADYESIFDQIREVVIRGDYTLGSAVDDFEKTFAKVVGTEHAIGVGSGTDAIFLSLKALGVGPDNNDEVIVPSFTFYATVGAIVTAGAKPVFAEIGDDFNIDATKIEKLITENTRAIVPVHWSGKPCQMEKVNEIASSYGISVVEDACHAISATYKGQKAGSFGDTGCFSLHPLKNLNVWGDGGLICTNSEKLAEKLRLMRNHGLSERNTCEIFAYNSRLDTIQAVVGSHLIKKLDHITQTRINNADFLDKELSKIAQLTLPPREHDSVKQVFHIYSILADRRDELDEYLQSRGIDSKIHYPVPMHLQPAAEKYGYVEGSLPITEKVAKSVISLPVHEFIKKNDLTKMVLEIKKFYGD